MQLYNTPHINLLQKLDDDLKKYMTCGIVLKTNEDLENLKKSPQDRKKWKELINVTYRTANAEREEPN